MVPLFAIAVIALRRVGVEPRVEFEIIAPRIEFGHRVGAFGMVEHHIENDRYTALVTRIDKRFELIGRTVCFVQSKIEGRVVAPTHIAFKFRNRHQFDSIDTEVLEIIQAVEQGGIVAFGGEIVYPELVYDQVFPIRTLEMEGCITPLERRLLRLNNGYVSAVSATGRITDEGRVHRFRFPLVVGMQHFLRIDVANLFLDSVCALYSILETVFFARSEARECNPEIVAIALELVVIAQFPIGHIAQQEHMLGRYQFG